MTTNIVEGTTAYILFQLLSAGVPVDLTDVAVALLLEDKDGTSVTAGTVAILDEDTGRVQLLPTNSSVFDASNGPYFARWQLTDGTGKISYIPTTNRDMWTIIGR